MTDIALVGSDASDLDVTDAGVIEPFLTDFGKSRYDVIYCSAGIYGPRHLSVVKPSGAELAEIMLTNCFGPIRLAHRLPGRMTESGTSAFMSSHRGSTTITSKAGSNSAEPARSPSISPRRRRPGACARA